MEFQATQVLDEGDSYSQNSQSSGSTQKSTEKIQIGTLEISETKHPIFKGITKIGRHPASDISINDITVSKHHAEIDAKPKRIWIYDKKSSNKTRMNGEHLIPERFYELHDGATLTFGLVKGLFMLSRSDDDSLLVPETPYPALRIRKISKKSLNETSASESDGSIVLGTQEYDENVFRRPSLPGTSRSPAVSRETSIHEAATQQFEITPKKLGDKLKKVSFHEMETQRFDPDGQADDSKAGDDADKSLHEMATQEFTNDTSGPGKKNIHEAETQKFDHDDKENGTNIQMNKTNDDKSIHDLETQVFDKEDDLVGKKKIIFDAETQDFDKSSVQDEKKNNSVLGGGKKKSIHELETQKFGDTADDIDPDETQAFDFDQTNEEKKIEGRDKNKSKDLDETVEFSPDTVGDIHEVPTQLFENEALTSGATENKSSNETNESPDLLEKKQETKQTRNFFENSDSDDEEDLLADLNKKNVVPVDVKSNNEERKKNIMDSDSDEEDLLLPMKNRSPQKVQKQKSLTPEVKKVANRFEILSDSDATDDEEVLNAKKLKNSSKPDEPKDDSPKLSEKNCEREKTPENSRPLSKNAGRNSKKSHESDSDITDEEGFFDALASPQKNLKKTSSNVPAAASSSKTENNEEDKNSKKLADNLSPSRSRVIPESDDDDTDEEEEKKINKNVPINKKEDNLLNDKNKSDDDSETDEEGIYALAPSRQASDLADDNSKVAKKPDDLLPLVPEEVSTKNAEQQEEEEEDPSECATQIIQPPKNLTKKIDPINVGLLDTQKLDLPETQPRIPSVNSSDSEDDDIAETQLIEPPGKKINKNLLNTEKKSAENDENVPMDYDDIATQIVDLPEIYRRRRPSPENKVVDFDDTEATQVIDTRQQPNPEIEDDNEDDDQAPTQIIPLKNSKQADLPPENDKSMEESLKVGEESINVKENQKKIGETSKTMESKLNSSESSDEMSMDTSGQNLTKSVVEDVETSPVKNDKKVATSTPFPNATKKKQFDLSLAEEEEDDEASLSVKNSKNDGKNLEEKKSKCDDGVSQNLNSLFGSEGTHEKEKIDGIDNLEALMTQQLEGILEPVDDDDAAENLENPGETSVASFTLQVSAETSKPLETSKAKEEIVEKRVVKEKSAEKIVEPTILPKRKVKNSNLSILLLDDVSTEEPKKDEPSKRKIKPGSFRTSRRNAKKIDDEESQDGYFSKLGGKKKSTKFSAIESPEDDDDDDEEVANLLKNTKSKEKSKENDKNVIYEPGTSGFVNGVAVESDEIVPLLASPNGPKNKHRQTPDSSKANKAGKSSSEVKTVNHRPPSSKSTKSTGSEDDVLAGLPEFDMSNYQVQSGDSRPSSSSRDVITPFEELPRNSPVPSKSPIPCKSTKSRKKSSSPLPIKAKPKKSPEAIKPVAVKKKSEDKLIPILDSDDDDDGDDEDDLGYEDIKKMADSFLTSKTTRRRQTLEKPEATPVKVKKEGKIHWKTALKNKQKTAENDEIIDITADEPPEKPRRGRPKRKIEDIEVNSTNESNSSVKSGKKLRLEKPVVPEEPFKSPNSTVKLDDSLESNKSTKSLKKQSKKSKPEDKVDEKSDKTDSDVSDNSEGRTRRGNAKKRPSTVYDIDGPRDVSVNSSGSSSPKKSKKDDSITNESPSRGVKSKSVVQNHVILFTGLSDVSYKNIAVKLGATVTDNPAKATILVTDKVRRTFKFFCAVSRSIPIASVNWIETSKKKGHFVDSDKFILHDPIAEAKFEFKLSKSLQKAGEKKLLDGYTIVITPKVNQPSINEIKSMISVSGGKALIRPPRVWLEKTVIISCEADGDNVKKITAKAPREIPVVTVEFILSGILKQELDEHRYKLKFD